LHKQLRVSLYYRVKSRFGTKFLPLVSLQRPVLITSFGDEAVRELTPATGELRRRRNPCG